MDTRPVAVAVDGSDHSLRALEWAIPTARRLAAELVIAHVLPDHTQLWAARRSALGPGPALNDPVTDRVRAALSGRDELPSVRFDSLEGEVPDALHALGSGARMLVMGSRGRGGFASLLLGSNSLAVATRAPCPVVVVPRLARTGADERTEGRVVLGLNLGETADDVIEFAFVEAAARRVPLQVLTAYPAPPPAALMVAGEYPPGPLDRDQYEPVERDMAGEQAERLSPFEARFPGVETDALIAPADAAGHLVDASASAALIVVGRHRRRLKPGSLLMGSVAHAVLHHTECPVAVVPDHSDD
ncbi:universal stress protein [Streptomyces sp. NBC_00083]|uniref:universal stress protein n=1 Tax=Streptomyces sp. NBC_00083 TaxID=2975647 RepID=UPI00224FC7E8|nr:universal stress protein [Streptomyces sp. NBC_00083]MCX5383904.1 universal stress protein [Streptomyces sp. NBC_00083]